MSSNLETLTQINLDDLVTSFGWQDHPLLSNFLRTALPQTGKNLCGIHGGI